MSVQIYCDAENVDPSALALAAGKKGKRTEHFEEQRTKIPKPCKTKRVALSTLSESQGVTCRVQPSRVVKGKTKNGKEATAGFSIFEDDLPLCPKETLQNFEDDLPLCSNETLDKKESPMILSPPMASVNSSFQELLQSTSLENIDLHSDPLLGVPEYAADVHSYLKKAERKYRPKLNYMRKQADITSGMRATLVDWLVEVAQEYKLKEQTLYLTVSYIDRFLSFMSVQRSKLQLVGVACMLIAAKFEEIYPPEVKEFVYITDDTFSSRQVLRMEHLILKTLAFDLSVPTCNDFMTRYLAAAGAPRESRLQYLSEYICQLSIVDVNCSVMYLPSMIAAASLCIANMVLQIPVWSSKLAFYTEFKLEEISECAKEICGIFKGAPTNQQQAIQTKYKSPKYGCVSEIDVPVDLSILNQFGYSAFS